MKHLLQLRRIKLQITCENMKWMNNYCTDYWPFVIEEMSDMSPPIRERLIGQKPVMTGGKMTLICTNDMELQTMKGKYATSFRMSIHHSDFRDLSSISQLTEEDNGAEEARMAFLAQRDC